MNGIDDIWAADLIDMQAFSKDNNGIKYLLTVIDIFSIFVWIIPLKRKTGQEIANAISRILKERRPSKMSVDRGREFYNKDVQKLVELYSTENEEKFCVIVRFNRTIKEKMFTYFSANNTRKFRDVLDLLVGVKWRVRRIASFALLKSVQILTLFGSFAFSGVTIGDAHGVGPSALSIMPCSSRAFSSSSTFC